MSINHTLRNSFSSTMICLLATLGVAFSSEARTPALIPAPQKIEWTAGELDCSRYKITAPTEACFAVAELERALAGAKKSSAGTKITLRLGSDMATNAEAYALDVTRGGVTITAPRPVGLFYGMQTLRQLLAGQTTVPCCRITDWPAFQWRGFMHDTGRNFQTLDSLKAQLEIFSAYKLNVFHWHLTDNPAWRIECHAFPQLNDPKFQTRDPGQIYTYAQIRELIAFARELHITIIPELDMPGHSDYFSRAFGFDMDSPRGQDVLEKLIAEFCTEIPATDCPYLHLGSDEVNVKDPQQFIARMLAAVRDHGRQAIVWNPGLRGDAHTIVQLWNDAVATKTAQQPGSPFVDSAGGYLSAYEPFALVQRYFFRQPCHHVKGDDQALGGILCCWPDVRVADKTNIFRFNPVWPVMLTFSESIWRGVPEDAPGFYSVLPSGDSALMKRFREFENRLAEHRDVFFANQPFPFVKYSHIPWRVIGPFYRGTNFRGDFAFEPEKQILPSYQFNMKSLAWQDVWGGTVMLADRDHEGVFKQQSLSTAYALTYIYSDTAKTIHAWIGFETPGRAMRQCGGIPPVGQWDAFGGTVLVNDVQLPAPQWRQPGKNRYLTETWGSPANEDPFTDEEFYWTREPAEVSLKAGWNKVLLRVPCGYIDQDWSFTFIPVRQDTKNARWIEDEDMHFAMKPEKVLGKDDR